MFARLQAAPANSHRPSQQYSRKRTAGEDTAVIKTEALASSLTQKRRRTSYLQPIDLVSSSDEDADSGEEDNPPDDPIPANYTDDAASEQDDPIPANYTDDAASEQSYHGGELQGHILAAIQNQVQNYAGRPNVSLDQVTNVLTCAAYMNGLNESRRNNLGEEDFKPRESRPPQNMSTGNFFGYRGPDLLKHCFDYQVVYKAYYSLPRYQRDAAVKFHNKFVGMRKFMAYCNTELHVSYEEMCQPHGCCNLFLANQGEHSTAVRLFADFMSGTYNHTGSTTCTNLKKINAFINFWHKWYRIAVRREDRPAMEQAFNIQDFQEHINQTSSIANAHRDRSITVQRNHMTEAYRRNCGLDLNLEEVKDFRRILFQQFMAVLVQRNVLSQQPSQDGEEGIMIDGDLWFVCNDPFKKLFIIDFEVVQADVMYLMALGGIGSQRPDVYFNFQDNEYQERHHGQSVQARLHTCRGKRKNTNRKHTFEMFQKETVAAMKVYRRMLQKASPEFKERRQAVAYTNQHCRTVDKLWFHLGEAIGGNNNPGVIPLFVPPEVSNYMVVPRGNLKTKFYNRVKTSLQNVMQLAHLPPVMNFFDLRKTMATWAVREWRRTKGRPAPIGEARRNEGVSLHWWLLSAANEMDTSLERLKLNYIYVPCNAVFSDQDLTEIDPAFRALNHPEVVPVQIGGAGERSRMAHQTVAQSVSTSFL